MKYGVLGDIHANLSALKAALDGLDGLGCERILSVGDVVGYGAAPKECIALLRERGVGVVLGNHDAACVGRLDDQYFNPFARSAMNWTRAQLSRDELGWLAELPYTLEREHCQMAHGTLHEPDAFHYALEMHDALPSLQIMERPVCFVGHSHIPLTVMRQANSTMTAYTTDDVIDLSEYEHALVNVGSVGQPRDEDPRAAFASYDTEKHVVRIHRADYDIEMEIARILGAGLPRVLAERLRLGV